MTVVVGPIVSTGTVRPHVLGDRQSFIENLTFSGTYKTGGDETFKTAIEALLKQQGEGTILWVEVDGTPGYKYTYNYETGKLQVFESGASGAVMKELAEAEYPALIRTGSKPRAFVLGV
jgi:hypothetical protein